MCAHHRHTQEKEGLKIRSWWPSSRANVCAACGAPQRNVSKAQVSVNAPPTHTHTTLFQRQLCLSCQGLVISSPHRVSNPQLHAPHPSLSQQTSLSTLSLQAFTLTELSKSVLPPPRNFFHCVAQKFLSTDVYKETDKNITNTREESWLLLTVGRDVPWWSHSGKQCGDCFKSWK